MDRAVPEPRGAVLIPGRAARHLDHRRIPPRPALAPFVRHHWFIRWSLDTPYTQSVLPLPCGNLVSERGALSASGVFLTRYDRPLEGTGEVFGTMLEPAGLRAILGLRGAQTANRRWDVAPELGWDADVLFDALVSDPDDEARVDRLTALLLTLNPRETPGMAEVNAWVALAAADPCLGSAEELARRAGVGLRTMQRALQDHVGVGPKTLLRRFRVLEAAARLAEGAAVDLTALAFTLGYADHAHLTRDFRGMVGMTPSAYAARCAQSRAS